VKSHKVPPAYTLKNYDMERIGYKVQDIAEEVDEEETRKQDELHQKIIHQLMTIHQLLETMLISPTQGSGEGPSTRQIEEAGTTRLSLI
jgi:hypothetical protein